MRVNLWKSMAVTAVAVGLLGVARPVQAQGVIQAVGGVTKTAEQNPVFAGMIGGKAGIIEIDGEFGKMMNIVPKRLLDTTLTLSGGEVKAELPAWYGLGQVRFIASGSPVQPFVTAGAGVARLHPQFTATDPDVNLRVVFGEDGDTTKFLVGAGGGLRVEAGKVAIDGGYRYMRVFQKYRSDTDFNNDDVLVNVHMFYVSAGFRF
jgi:hypothetical protein